MKYVSEEERAGISATEAQLREAIRTPFRDRTPKQVALRKAWARGVRAGARVSIRFPS